MRLLISVLLGVLVLSACTSDPASEYKELNLTSYGIPLSIMAPDSAKIKKEDWITQQSVSVSQGDYDVQVWAGERPGDLATVKANKLAEVKSSDIFSSIIQEDPSGFLFENKLDSSTLYYGFYHFVVQGDYLYTFQNGLRGNFTKDQAERMYAAVQPKK
jgi:hypothetical protein